MATFSRLLSRVQTLLSTSLQLCSQKGFICETCHSSNVIYPLDVEDTYQVRTLMRSDIVTHCCIRIQTLGSPC